MLQVITKNKFSKQGNNDRGDEKNAELSINNP